MSKIKQFDKQNLREIRQYMEAAFKAISDKFDIDLEMGGVRFTGSSFSARITASTRGQASGVMQIGDIKIPYTTGRKYVNGTKFVVNGTEYVVVSYAPNRRKYPYVGVGPQGGRWKFTEQNITNGLVA